MKKNQTRNKIDEIKAIILDYLSYRHVMNFAEIELIFDLFGIDWQGDQIIGKTKQNIVFWQGWNKETTKAFYELFNDHKIFIIPTKKALPVYDEFEIKPLIPIAHDLEAHYNDLHWLPSLILDEVSTGIK